MGRLSQFLSGRTLTERLVVGLAGMVAVVAAIYAAALSESIEFTERTLLSGFMQDEFAYLAAEYDRGDLRRLPDGVMLYAAGTEPERYRRSAMGYAELGDDPAVFVYKGQSPAGQTLTMVLDQADFEAREREIRSVVWMSLLAVLALAAFAGWRLSRMVLQPVERLAADMRRAAESSSYVPVAPADAKPPADAVAQLARICDEALRNVHQALDREKAFTGDVSHELRTPLTVIETSAEMLRETPLTAAQQRSLEKIERASAAMRSLLEVFLALARETQTRAAEMAGVGAVLAGLAADWEEQAREKCRRAGLPQDALAVELLKLGDCPGRHNAAHLETIAGNLLKNAVSYTPSGLVAAAETPEGVLVADSGPGIAADVRSRIFEPFERGIPAGDGMGLGLSIARRLARRNGWRLELLDEAAVPPEILARFASKGLSVGAVFRLSLGSQLERSDLAESVQR